jgi:regulator of sirC expression with transglutaminase-like and TPR domain
LKPLWPRRRNEVRRRFARALAAEGRLDVIRAALWIAAEEYPELDVRAEMKQLADLSRGSAARAGDERNPFARLERLRGFMFDDLGFRGNVKNYDDPRNSFLNEVVARRTGNPLTLSLVFREFADASGFEVRGVGLPGHFVLRVGWEGRQIFVDPFNGGGVITEEDCRDLVGRSTGKPSLFRRQHLEGVNGRAMIGRMLLNLKHLYLNRSDYGRALSVVERLLLVSPGNTREIRDKGFLEAHLGMPAEAIADLETYIELAPRAPDIESVRGRVVWLRRKLSETN